MKTFPLAASIVAALLTLAAPAAAQPGNRGANCDLRIQTSASNWFVDGYDPFASNAPIATFDVTFINDGGAACRFDPVFVLDQEPFGLTRNSGPRRVSYTLLDLFSNTNATPTSGRTINTATRRVVVVQPNSQQIVRYQFAADDTGLNADGLYSQRVTLIADQRGQGGTLASRALVLGVNVLPSAVLGLSGQFTRVGGQALINLGELREGAAGVPLQIRVASTRAYRLEFVSKNSGRLMLPDTRWSVPYSLGVGKRSIALTGPATYDSAGRNSAVDALPLEFVVGDASGRRAGTYSDILTVSVAPR